MTTDIIQYREGYHVHFKDGSIEKISKEGGDILRGQLADKPFVSVNGTTHSRYEIIKVSPMKSESEAENLLEEQTLQIQDKVRNDCMKRDMTRKTVTIGRMKQYIRVAKEELGIK